MTPSPTHPARLSHSKLTSPASHARFLVVLLVAAIAAGCSAGPEPGSATDRAYLVLATRSIEPEPPPVGFYIAGERRGEHFQPVSEVLGAGDFDGDGHPGWLELGDLTFHGDETGRAPFPPYVQGRLGDDGAFHPASRDVSY